MKKILYMTVAVAALLIASCSGKNSTPGKAAKQYAEYIVAGDVDKYVDGIAFNEGTSAEDIEQSKTMLTSLMNEKVKPTLEEKGGIKNIEVVSEKIAEDGQSAEVVLKQTYGNGETEEQTTNMVLVDGVWKMKINK